MLPIDERLALFAARISLNRHLAMGHAMIHDTALAAARLVTSDVHFRDLPNVTLIGG